jgi:hypothetical protein
MRTMTTTSGTPIESEVEIDLLAVIETLFRDLIRRHGLAYGYEDVHREFAHVVRQLDETELRGYLTESLLLNFARFEVDQMMLVERRATSAEEETS